MKERGDREGRSRSVRNTSKQIYHNLWYFPVVVLCRNSAMSKDIDLATRRSASEGDHRSNIEEELAKSSVGYFLMKT
jgi:hypothetical protein